MATRCQGEVANGALAVVSEAQRRSRCQQALELPLLLDTGRHESRWSAGSRAALSAMRTSSEEDTSRGGGQR